MSQLEISRLFDMNELQGFLCGIEGIDDLIQKHLPGILRDDTTPTYAARVDGNSDVAAVFTLRQGELVLDTYDVMEINNEYFDVDDEDVRYEKYPAIELELLGVSKSYQHQGIGRAVIDTISGNYEAFGYPDSLFILVDAYYCDGYTAVPFYERCGFNSTGQRVIAETLRMYKKL